MKIWDSIFSVFGRNKTTPYNLGMTIGYSRDKEHPERKVSVQRTNEEANTLRYTNDIVSAYDRTVKRGVVGSGFSLQFKTDNPEINTQVEDWLEYCSEKGNADFTRKLFRQKLERMIASELAIKGGVMIRHHWDKRFPTLYAPEILSMDTIDRSKFDFAKGLYSGIQTNKFGQITGVWIYKDQKRLGSVFVPKKNIEIEVLEYDPHQYGNISPLATIMLRLDDMTVYTEQELKNAKKRAEKSLVAATPAVDNYLLAIEDYIAQETKRGNTAEAERARQEYQKALKEFSAPGFHDAAQMMHKETKIWDLQKTDSSQYNDLLLQSKQTVSRGLGYSIASIMGIPENSYNSALKSAQEEEEENAILGQSVITICKEIYRRQIEAGVILNELNIPDYYSNKRYYDRKLSVTRRIKGHIDPSKQKSADKLAVDNGFDSKIALIAGQNKDYEDVIADEVRYETARREAFKKAGLSYIQTGTEQLTIEKTKQDAKTKENTTAKELQNEIDTTKAELEKAKQQQMKKEEEIKYLEDIKNQLGV
jgi:capsid protein